ncbi:MAG: hypothetical protein ABH950_03625 [Candidatus Altiarchaeota archaeon]
MDEKKLKAEVAELQSKINGFDEEIRKIYSEISVHQKDADKFRRGRDQKNNEAKEVLALAKKFISQRDEFNSKVAELKKERKQLIDKASAKNKKIKSAKEKRNELNKDARGTNDMLEDIFRSDLHSLLEKDMPLDVEIKLYEKIFSTWNRLKAVKRADQLHSDVVNSYREITSMHERINGSGDEIQKLAQESEKNHIQAMEYYKQLDAIREESTKIHHKLLEKYDKINPYRDKVREIKDRINDVQEQMKPINQQLEAIDSERNQEERVKKAEAVKEKLSKRKRISLDDFRILLGKEEILKEIPRD